MYRKRIYIPWVWQVIPSHYESCCRKVKELFYDKNIGNLHEIMKLLWYKDAGVIHKYKNMEDCKNAGKRRSRSINHYY